MGDPQVAMVMDSLEVTVGKPLGVFVALPSPPSSEMEVHLPSGND